MDVTVLTQRGIEIELDFQHVQKGTLEAVHSNGELLQKLADLNEELNTSDLTMSELERSLEQVRKESLRLKKLIEQSLYISENLQSTSPATAVESLEREMWRLERERRLLSSMPTPPETQPPSPASVTAPELRDDILNIKEPLVELKRHVQHITQSPLSPTPLPHSRNSTVQRDYHHGYNNKLEFSIQSPRNPPKMIQSTPIRTNFYRGLPTPPATASSTSSIASGHERFNSPLSKWSQMDESPIDLSPEPRKTPSYKTIVPSTPNTTLLNVKDTPRIRRSSSHDSIFEPDSTLPSSQVSSPCQSSQSSSLSSSVAPSPTYLSATAYLRQNNTSSLLMLSSSRGKQSAGLSSRKSFWNLWDNWSAREAPSPRKVSPSSNPRRQVECTEVDTEMLQNALEGLIYETE